jgi:probable HAF family extracellular repeat protein
MQDLISLTENCPTCQGVATAINEGGEIVGEIAANSKGYSTAFTWRNGHVRLLGMLGGRRGARSSAATGVNKSGQVVGVSTVASGDLHPFLWTDSGGMQDLGLLPNAVECFAYGINDTAQVVGYCVLTDSTARAFIWTASAGMQDIGTLGGVNAIALAINNAGQVAGRAETQ